MGSFLATQQIGTVPVTRLFHAASKFAQQCGVVETMHACHTVHMTYQWHSNSAVSPPLPVFAGSNAGTNPLGDDIVPQHTIRDQVVLMSST